MFYKETKSDITFVKSSLLDSENLVHGFSTRFGGDTPEPLDSFSLSNIGMPVFKEIVEKNRKKACDVLNVDYKKLIIPDQKHTDNIQIVSDTNCDLSDTDGVITDVSGLVLMLMFADCTPIILHAPNQNVLGVIHAGWRGTAKGITSKAVGIFRDNFGVPPHKIRAAIGPAIGQCCYEVSVDVADELKKSICENNTNIFNNSLNQNKIRVDLKKLNAQQLLEAGVQEIDVIEDCTSCNNGLYYSYRADNGKTGRHSAIASLK